MRRSRVLLLALALAAGDGAAQKATPGQVAYVQGVRAFDGGDYATAAAQMRVALAEETREGVARFRYRAQNAEDYFPHLWLGLSLEKLGDAAGARTALQESSRQGAVAARPALARILASALARLAPPPTPTARPAPVEPTAAPAPEAPATVPAAAPTAGPLARPTVAPLLPPPAPPRTAAVSSPRAARAAVRAGARAFVRGEYGRAEELLAPAAEGDPLARLLLAWSLGGRYLLAPSPDEALLARARAEHAAALGRGAPAQGSPWVSPAILALFRAGDATRRAP